MNVSTIQNMFQGNPYSTPVGALVERATDAALTSEDWGLFMDIVDNINRSDNGPRDAIRALKKRLGSSVGKHNASVMLVLTCTETCVKNCGYRFHVQVASKEFVHELLKIIDVRNMPTQMLQSRVLGLLQSWTDAFRGEPELREVERTVMELRQKGYDFPMTDLDQMAPIHTPKRSVPEAAVLPKQSNLQQQQPQPQQHPVPGHPMLVHPQHHVQPQHHTPPQPQQQQPQSQAALASPKQMHPQHHQPHPQQNFPSQQMHAARPTHPTAMTNLSNTGGPVTPTPDQVAKLSHDLQIVTGNVRVFNEMLNELNPTLISPEDLSLMQELHRTCRAMQQRIMELLEQLAHEELTSELLRVNDDLNNVFVRYGRFERFRSQQGAADGAQQGASAGVAAAAATGAATGKAAGAVATPKPQASAAAAAQQQNNSSSPPSYHQATAGDAGIGPSLIDLEDPNDLSKRLSDVRVSGESAGAQLSKLPSTTAANAAQVDEFDAFAQSRTMAHAGEARRAPADMGFAPDPAAASGLSSATQQRGDEGFLPGIPDSKEELDEMERWMATHDSLGSDVKF